MEQGNYGLIYGHLQDAVRFLVSGLLSVGPFDETAINVRQDFGWARIDGSLRYVTSPGDGSSSYYVAKLTNLLIVAAAVLIFRWAWTRRAADRTIAKQKSALYVLALLMPAVCYQIDQVSTDLVFILMSVGLYFVESRKGRLVYAASAFALISEDRSFAILGVTAFGYAILPSIVPWRAVRESPGVRYAILIGAMVLGVVGGTVVAHTIQLGTGSFVQQLQSAPGFSDPAAQLRYTWGKNFNPLQSPVIMYAGLVYLPSAAEFFVRTIPLYLAALVVFVRLVRLTANDRGELGQRFFYLLVSVVITFFGLTNATHVFEHGRYYLTLAPMIVLSLASLLTGQSRALIPDSRTLSLISALFVTLNVGLTVLVALPTLR